MGLAGLRDLQGVVVVVGDSGGGGGGCSFTSVVLGVGSRAVGDRARLACRGAKEHPEVKMISSAFCSN